MTDLQLRLPLGLGHRLRELVYARADHEVVAFCLVSDVEIGSTRVLLVRDVIALGDRDYLDPDGHGAAWRGASMLPVIELAMRDGLGIVLVHAHDFPGKARLSPTDLASARRLVPMFGARVPGRPHASIVLGRGTAAGFVALPGREPQHVNDVRVRWLGKSILDWPTADGDPTLDVDVFDRQALVVADQGALARARVVVVGLCGGGSHVVQQLAHAGIGTIVGIDDDLCDRTNLHREIGMRLADGRRRTLKTQVMSRLVRSIGTGSKFVGIQARVPDPRTLEVLTSADVIVGCVDNVHARADLMEIAWRNAVPFVDVGVNIRGLERPASEPRVAIGGNVYVFIPGGFCGWCCGFITEDKLRAERDDRDDRSYFQNKKGEAQVVSFNAVVAGQAVSEVLQLLTAYRGSSLDPVELRVADGRQRGVLKFDGIRGTLEEWGAMRRDDCPVCNKSLAAGSLLWYPTETPTVYHGSQMTPRGSSAVTRAIRFPGVS